MTARFIAAALFSVAVFSCSPASAQTVCTARDKAIAHLSTKYTESPVAMGLAANGGVVEMLTSPNGKTWSILITMPDGTTCLVAAGETWERLKPGQGL